MATRGSSPRQLKAEERAASEPNDNTAEMMLAMSQASSTTAGPAPYCGSPSAPSFFDDPAGYQTQQSRLSISPEEPAIDLNTTPVFAESAALRRTASKGGDSTASRGQLFGYPGASAGEQVGVVRFCCCAARPCYLCVVVILIAPSGR